MSSGRLDVLVVRESNGKSFWTKVGVAFPNRSGEGYTVKLDALPINGELKLMPPREPRGSQPAREPEGDGWGDAKEPEDTIPY